MGMSGYVAPGLHFNPGERTSGTHRTGGWAGLRAGLVTEARGNNPLTPPGIEPRSLGHPVRSHSVLTELPLLIVVCVAGGNKMAWCCITLDFDDTFISLQVLADGG
jgi:hypothetical protein